jgi:hypothetical protein
MLKKFRIIVVLNLLFFVFVFTSFTNALPGGKIVEFNASQNCILDESNTFIVYVDASKWTDKDNIFRNLGVAFNFKHPDWNPKYWNWDFFADWIRELEWIREKKVDFCIYNLTKFIANTGVNILEIFTDYVIPYWNEDISENSKQFNFYYN